MRESNEDSFGEFTDAERGVLLVVADGMGGHRGGETASRLAVDVIGKTFQTREDPPAELLRRAVDAANLRVHGRAARDPALEGMGTTVVALFVARGGEGFVAHVGDSRLYRLRGGALEPLTEDHTLVGELEREGYLTRDEAFAHPRRNELLRGVGLAEDVEVDVERIDLARGDRLLLCSDGLCGYVQDAEIRSALALGTPAQAAEALIELANAKGGEDNVTVQVIDV